MTKVVRVSIVQPRPLDDPRVFMKECVALRNAGYQVVHLCVHPRDEFVDGIQLRALPRPANRLARMLLTTRQAYLACLREDAAVYHFHDPELLPLMQGLVRRGRRVIYDMHENVVKDILTKPWVPRPLRGPVSAFVRRWMPTWVRGMAVIFAETSYAQDYPYITDGIDVLNLPRLETLRGISLEPSPTPGVGYLGGVTRERGVLNVLKALALLRRRGLAVGFECVGPASPEFQRELTQFAAEQQLTAVRFHGFLPPAAGYRVMARCWLGLAVIDAIPNYVESYPTKMFEYLALGLPVVVSDFPLYRRIVDEAQCGKCVPPQDPERLAATIGELIEQRESAIAMGQRGRQMVLANYSWETEEAKLLALYARLTGEPAAVVPA